MTMLHWHVVCLVFCIGTVVCPLPKGYRCPDNIYIGYRETPPYVVYNKTHDTVEGAIIDILEDALINSCCTNNVTLHYDEYYIEYATLVEKSVNSSMDIVLPIRSSPEKDKFLTFPFLNHMCAIPFTRAAVYQSCKFVKIHDDMKGRGDLFFAKDYQEQIDNSSELVSLVESPGAVLYNLGKGSAGNAIKKSVIACLPLVILLSVWVCIIGVAFWIAEIQPKKCGRDRSIRDMMVELWEGIWWSFITLATVGYGDILPTRLISRVLCYIWLLCSSVVIAAYTATVTSVLVAECFSATLEIKGSDIGVLKGTKEHRTVLQKNGFPLAYTDMNDFLYALKTHKDMEGALVELYSASYYQEYFMNYRIETVIEDVSGYGVVLRTRTIKLQNCLVQHVLSSQGEIYDNIRKQFPPLKTNFTKTIIEETSQSLLSPSQEHIRGSLIAISSVLLVLCVLGILREKIFLNRPRKTDNNLENFVLLQTIKADYNEALKKSMDALQADIIQLQSGLERISQNISASTNQNQTMFRANYNNESD